MCRIRNFTRPDLERLRDLYVRTGESGLWGNAVGGRQLELLLQRPQYSPEADLFVAEKRERKRLVGFADVMREVRIGRVVLDLYVEPRYRGRGLGGRLLDRVSGRASALGAQRLHACVDEANSPGQNFLRKQGFSQVRRYLVLERSDVSSFGDVEVDFGDFDLGKLSGGEEQVLAEIQNRCFEGSWGFCPNTAEEVGFYLALTMTPIQDVPVLRQGEAGEVAGYLWPQVMQRNRSEGEAHGWIHMVGVRPDLRGRGLGKELVKAGLLSFAEQGVKNVELTVDEQNRAAVQIYRKLGFHTKARKLWFEREVA